ncbi:MAG TPA: ISL3 family transposase [Ktedonobacterales bacterium]|nr:ISL3 family transposase [Ktedonobacterales bacterium]
MSLQSLFPHLRGFRLLAFCREPDRLILRCERITHSAHCPLCGTKAQRVHSWYQRTVMDLPLQHTPVLLHLRGRKFYCDQPTCPRRIFTERLPQVTAPHGRFTFALQQWLARLGQEHGGASSARSAKLLGLRVSGRGILRRLHALPLPAFPPPQVIGLDDWAWKRRERYGTTIVDLERGKPIALLAERSQGCVTQWLKHHPTITVVARDRSKEFAAAITAALPQAQQVADRFHLAKNLTEQLDKVVSARWKVLTNAWRPAEAPAAPVPAVRPEQLRPPSPGEARYQQALTLAQAGDSVKLIAQRLGVSHQTIYRWLAQEHGPHAGLRKPRRNALEWITPYLHRRWEEGERQGLVLWEEVKAQGYRGSLRSIYRRLGRWRDGPRRRSSSAALVSVLPSPLEDLTPGKIIGWIIARPETLTPAATQRLEVVCQLDPVIAQARDLTWRWLSFIRRHTNEGLEAWLGQMRTSGLSAFVSFARSVEQDKAAIVAGLSLPYSTGPVEGHITRLKLIKRHASGRASLPYLERRFLPVA